MREFEKSNRLLLTYGHLSKRPLTKTDLNLTDNQYVDLHHNFAPNFAAWFNLQHQSTIGNYVLAGHRAYRLANNSGYGNDKSSIFWLSTQTR